MVEVPSLWFSQLSSVIMSGSPLRPSIYSLVEVGGGMPLPRFGHLTLPVVLIVGICSALLFSTVRDAAYERSIADEPNNSLCKGI